MVTEHGGKKQLWLRENRELVLSFYAEFGEDKTLSEFSMTARTLDRFLRRYAGQSPTMAGPIDDVNKKISAQARDIELANMRLAACEAGIGEHRREVRSLREDYRRFVPAVAQQVADFLCVPLLRSGIKLPPELVNDRVEYLADFGQQEGDSEADNVE